jgi:hypothetical protein
MDRRPLPAGHWRRAQPIPISWLERLRLARETQLVHVLTLGFVIFFLIPVAVSAILYLMDDRVANWKTADRSSVGLLPPAGPDLGAVVRIFSARTVRWRGIVATHSWIVVKEAGATAYSRFDYTAWGKPSWIDRFVPDGRWFGRTPEVVFAADGPAADRMIPRIREAVRNFPYPNIGDSCVAGTQFEHVCDGDHECRPGNGRNAAADCHRQGLPC